MLIVFICLLTILSMSLRLASMSIDMVRKVQYRLNSIKGSETKKHVGIVYKSAESIIKLFRIVVSMFRNILIAVLPIILILDIIVFLIISAVSSSSVISSIVDESEQSVEYSSYSELGASEDE